MLHLGRRSRQRPPTLPDHVASAGARARPSRAVHRPVRADDGRRRAAPTAPPTGDCVFEVFARRLPARPPLRRRRRHRPAAGGAPALPVRRRRARPRCATQGVTDAATAATGWPTSGSAATSTATPRATSTSPARRCSPSRAPFAEARAAGDARAVGAQPRQRDRLGRRPHGRRRRASRPCIEMGSRRTHEEAAVAAARAAYLVGFGTTSNLEAGRRYGVPTRGTSAHAFTLLHDDEEAARSARRSPRSGAGTTLLVDTYDVDAGHPDGGRGRRARARRRSGSTPATCRRSPPTPGSCSTSSAPPRPGSSSPATSTSTPSPGSRPHRSTATASAPRWSPAPARRRSAWSTSSSSATACRWRRSPRTRSRSAAARTPSAGTAPRAPRRRRSCTRRAPPFHATATAPCRCRSSGTASHWSCPTLDESRAHLQSVLTTLPWRGLSLSRGEPAIPTTYEEPHA